jgi:hypothetical protein
MITIWLIINIGIPVYGYLLVRTYCRERQARK